MMSSQVCETLRHLLDNACKFSPAGGQIELIVKPIGQAGVEVFVRDKGIGIEPNSTSAYLTNFTRWIYLCNPGDFGHGQQRG